MWQKFMLLSLTPIILHLTCQPRRVKWLWRNYLWQWPEARIELCFVSTCHQTCMDVFRAGSLQQVGSAEECMGGLYQLVLVKVDIYCACLFCAAAVWLRHSGPPRSAPLLSPRLSGRKVLMAAAMPDSLSICCGWHSSFTVTSLRLTALARAPCYFCSSLQTLHLIDAIFRNELINDLCWGRCELLHSNQSRQNDGVVKQLIHFISL